MTEGARLADQLRDTADFLRRCRGTEPASHFEAHAIECEKAADFLSREDAPQGREAQVNRSGFKLCGRCGVTLPCHAHPKER